MKIFFFLKSIDLKKFFYNMSFFSFNFSDGGSLKDSNGNELILFSVVSDAVNELTFKNAATGDNPTIVCSGEVDTGITFQNSEGEEILILNSIASSVNEITISSAATGNNPLIACTGEADTGITFQNAGGEEILILNSIASSVNEITIASAATGDNPTIACTGEANTGITFQNSEAEEILILDSVASSVNEITIASAATGAGPSITASGGDSNIDLNLASKGTGIVKVISESTTTNVLELSADSLTLGSALKITTNTTNAKALEIASGFLVMTPQTITIADGDSVASADLTFFKSSVILIDMNDTTTTDTYVRVVKDGLGTTTYNEGQIVHLFYDTAGAALSLDFTDGALVGGSGIAQFLQFTSTGQSATLIYIGSKWRIINTGASIS